MRHVARLCSAESEKARLIVVVSALGGVTDELEEALVLAESRGGDHRAILERIRARHEAMIAVVGPEAEREAITAQLEAVWSGLDKRLEGVSLLGECTARARDAVMGAGELASAPILTAAIQAEGVMAAMADARELIRTDDAFGNASVDVDATRERCTDLSERAETNVIVIP
jgi:aspartokinase/homoserine dehydrogenase 1